MAKNSTVDKVIGIEMHLKSKRNELMWALQLQDYTPAQIGRIFNVDRSTAMRVIGSRPKDWRVKWHKVQE